VDWWDTLPMVWLLLMCIYDWQDGFSLRNFYCNTIRDIILKIEHVRPNCSKRDCPVFQLILDNKANLETFCPDQIDVPPNNSHFLGFMKRMSMRYQQAAFFEVIFIQLFICFIESDVINQTRLAVFYGIMTLAFFFFPYLKFTYFSQGTNIFYENIYLRTATVVTILYVILSLN
jgi:hypothetical protein